MCQPSLIMKLNNIEIKEATNRLIEEKTDKEKMKK